MAGNKSPQLMCLKQQKFIFSQFWSPKPRCCQSSALSRGTVGDWIVLLNQLQVAARISWIVVASLPSPLPWAPCFLLVYLCAVCFSPSLTRTLVIGCGSLWIIHDILPMSRSLSWNFFLLGNIYWFQELGPIVLLVAIIQLTTEGKMSLLYLI